MSRRSLVRAAAWGMPVVVAAASAPAAVASDPPTLAVDVEYPFVDAWQAGTTSFFVRDASTGAAFAGATALSITSGGSFENEPVTAAITEGWADVPLVPVFPAQGAVVATVVVTTAAGTATRLVTLTILNDPGLYVTRNSASVPEGYPVVIEAGAASDTYVYQPGFGWTMGPRVQFEPITQPDAACVLTDAGGLIRGGTYPAPATAAELAAAAFFPLGGGGFGGGTFALHLEYRGYSADRSVPYEIVSVPFFVQSATGRNEIQLFGEPPFGAWFRMMIEHASGGGEGALAGAAVRVTDQSGKLDTSTGFGDHVADGEGVLQLPWSPLPDASGSGTVEFVIESELYTQTVLVTYTLP